MTINLKQTPLDRITMSTATDLAPLGGVLDSLLARLATMEKFAESQSSSATTETAQPTAPPTQPPSETVTPSKEPSPLTLPETDAPPTPNVVSPAPSPKTVAANLTDDEPPQGLVESLNAEIADLRNKLENSEKQRERLERQLANEGIKVAEDIPYEVAKAKIKSIAERMQEIGSSNIEHSDKEKEKQLREDYFTLVRQTFHHLQKQATPFPHLQTNENLQK